MAGGGELSALRDRTTWYGVYLGETKIGWQRSSVKKVGEHYRIENEAEMRIQALGAPQHMTSLMSIDFTGELQPLAYNVHMAMTNMEITGSGEVRDGILYSRSKTPQGERTEEIDISKRDIYGLDMLRQAAKGYRVGDVIEGEIFDPTQMLGVVPYRMEITGESTVRFADREEKIFHVQSSLAGLESMVSVTEEGDLIRAEMPMGFVVKRESEEVAKNLGDVSKLTDLILAFAVDAGKMIDNPASLRRAVIAVKGLGNEDFTGAAQHVGSPDENGVRLVTVDLDAAQAKETDLNQYLKASAYIQSADRRVIEKAKELVKGLKTDAEKVRRIHDWVHSSVRKEPAFTLPSTVDVLATMAGDCNEHAALVAGLLRAANVPTRIAAGLAYMNGKFYYHAWNESWFDGKWVPTDATFGEYPASPLRIRLTIGDLAEQIKIAAYAGRISTEIKGVE